MHSFRNAAHDFGSAAGGLGCCGHHGILDHSRALFRRRRGKVALAEGLEGEVEAGTEEPCGADLLGIKSVNKVGKEGAMEGSWEPYHAH